MNILENTNGNDIVTALIQIKRILEENIQHNIVKEELINIARKKKNKYPNIWKDVRKLFGVILKLLKKNNINKDLMKKLYFTEVEKLGKIYLIENNTIMPIPLYHEKVKVVSTCSKSNLNNTTHILTEYNKVFVIGSNEWGKGGIDYNLTKKINVWTEIESLENCKNIFSGYSYTFFVTNTAIKACGFGDNGRLGIGEGFNNSNNLNNVILDEEIKKISAGSTNSIFLSKKGEVFSCGELKYLGYYSDKDQIVPKKVVLPTEYPIVDISCQHGAYHVLCLDTNGSVYAWGHNRVGQLGIITTEKIVTLPIKIKFKVPIKKISGGWGTSSFIDFNNRIYSFGRNDCGQTGWELEDSFKTNDSRETLISCILDPLPFKYVTDIFSCQNITYILKNNYERITLQYLGCVKGENYYENPQTILGLESFLEKNIKICSDNILFITDN